jgi:hypothetical protein
MVDGLLKIKLGFKKPKEVEGIKVEVKWCLTTRKNLTG